MKQTTTLIKLWRLFGKTLPVLVLLAFSLSTVKAQLVNGNLGTGATSLSGIAAPAGTQWHEMQGSATQTNVSIAFDNSPIFGSSRVADNFTVPAGIQWNLNKMTFYAVVLPPPPGTSPITAVRVVIRDASPVGASNVIYGDLTTNRLSATSFANIYTIPNSQVPAPGTPPNQNFVVWKVEAAVSTTLAPGNYWVEWQFVGGAGQRVFALMSQPIGARTLPGYNGVNTFNSAPWGPTLDAGSPANIPVAVDYCFGADYTTSPCTSPTASVLSQVLGAPVPTNLYNETFNTVAPLPAGWASQNLSNPVGLTGWFQGNVGVFPGNTAPGYIGANFNNTTGTNIISNWLFAPNVTLKNGDKFSFWTRTTTGAFPDRLQVRMSTNGASTNAGATNTSVGDFTTLLADINPTYTGTGYPTAWTQYNLTMSGLPAAGISGRIAFRYFVENAGPGGANSDYIGIDDVIYTTFNPGPITTCTGSTANLKVDITGGNSPYTVVINRTPGGLLPPITGYVSGTSIPVTPGVTTTYNLVSVTGCGVGTGNSGTPTITVSATPISAIVIQDNPTGPLCAGDPKLLTVIGAPGIATFTSPAGLIINAFGTATPYPLPLVVAGLPAGATVQSVKLTNLNHTWTGDIDVAITGPTFVAGGNTQAAMLLSDLGNDGFDAAVNCNLTFQDGSPRVPNVSPIPSGTYSCTNDGLVADAMPLPGPSTIAANPLLTQLNSATMNGTWNLWINDQVGGDGGNLASYSITFAFPPAPPPVGWTFFWSPAAGLSSTTSNPTAASPMTTTTYTVLATAPSGCQTTASILITVNQLPAVTSNPVNKVACQGATVTFTVGASGSNITYQWQESTTGAGGPWNNITNGGVYGGATTPTLTLTGVTALMNNNRYRCVINGICPPPAISTNALLTVNGLPVIQITPPGPVCGGVPGISGTQITAGSTAPPIPGSLSFTSGVINVPIPEGAFPAPPATAATNTIAVSGIPANATITNIHVKSNITHAYVADVIMVLKAPNGQILNLDALLNYTNNPGANFVNTVISSAGVNTLSSGTAPWSNTFKADLSGATFSFAGFTLAGGPVGYTPTTTNWGALYPNPNGNWTIAAYDAGAPDVGNLTNWQITIDYTTPGGSGNPLTYTWSPAAGLYTNATATTPYIAGSQASTLYAAPVVNTVYTVTGTDGTTGCTNTGTIAVVYTPPAPTVTPASVAMCLGDAAAKLSITSSLAPSPFTSTFSSGPITVPFPGPPAPNYPAGASHSIAVPLPATAAISRIEVAVNFSHTWDGDVVAVLKAPNNQVLNLDYFLSNTGGTGATTGFTNTRFASNGVNAISTGTNPYNGVFKADAQTVAGGNGPTGPTGMTATTGLWTALYSVPNGNWTLGLYDNFAGDDGVLTSWSITFDYLYGPPASGVWSPITGLWKDAAATVAYNTGDTANTVYAKPLTVGVNPYTVTVQSLGFDVFPSFTNPAPITIPSVGTGTPYPSNLVVSGLPTSGASVQTVTLIGLSHTWESDIAVALQSPTGINNILMASVGGANVVTNVTYTFKDGSPALTTGVNPTGTYRTTNLAGSHNFPAPGPGPLATANPLASFTGNMNGTWKLFVIDEAAGDQGQFAGGYSIQFRHPGPGCVSPARTVNVTVNAPTTVATQPVNQTICTDKVATFTVVAGGTGPFSYQWQVSTDNGNTFSNITNGGVYSGATTATLTITAPPVTMNGYAFRVIINGAAPCAPATSFFRILTVNPLPTIVITANPTKLLPGMRIPISSTVTPNAAASNGYVWLRDGVAVTSTSTGIVSGVGTGLLTIDVDGMGNYQLRVTDVNGCTNVSNTVSITDSVSGKCFIYPNPNSGKFQVRYYSALNNVLPRGVSVFDAKGDRVLTQSYIVGRPYDRMDVDLRKFGKGLYWVEIIDTNGNRLTMCRVVVQ